MGVFRTVGDIMSTVGDNVEDILSTMGVLSTVGDIMMHVGEYIMSTVGGYHDTCGRYHEYRGGVQYHGILK